MTEYIDKGALYSKIAEIEQKLMEEAAQDRAMVSAICTQGELRAYTSVKYIIADFPAANVTTVVRGERQPDCPLEEVPDNGI